MCGKRVCVCEEWIVLREYSHVVTPMFTHSTHNGTHNQKRTLPGRYRIRHCMVSRILSMVLISPSLALMYVGSVSLSVGRSEMSPE